MGGTIVGTVGAGNMEVIMASKSDDVEDDVEIDCGDGKRKRVDCGDQAQYVTLTQDKGCSYEDGPTPKNSEATGFVGQTRRAQ